MSTLGVSSHLTTRLRTISSRRYRRGAGALVAVLLLAAFAGTGLAVHFAAQHAARQTAQAFEAGRVFAAWVLSAPLEVPAALRRPVTIDWIGPVETLAERLAAYAGYRFRTAGLAPVRPVMVAIAAQDAPVIEVLRDAGLQAGDAATLTVDAEERSVRLDWAAAPLPSRPGAPVAAPGEEGA